MNHFGHFKIRKSHLLIISPIHIKNEKHENSATSNFYKVCFLNMLNEQNQFSHQLLTRQLFFQTQSYISRLQEFISGDRITKNKQRLN